MIKSICIKTSVTAILLIIPFLYNSCKSVKVPNDITVVENFDIMSYTGRWYEVARFDFKYEKNLGNVTAEYSLMEDGSIKVLNKGFDTVKNEWKESEGKAEFIGDNSKGALKVSFFGPFYSGYNVVSIEPNYKNTLVMGESKDYIWLLSREKVMTEDVKNKYLEIAKESGYDLSRLVWTVQK